MAEGVWVVQEVGLSGPSLFLRVPTVLKIHPKPGQYFRVFAPGFHETISQPLFLCGETNHSWEVAGNILPHWQPGTKLSWRGPYGHGFTLPPSASRVAILPWKVQGLTLLPLVQEALKKQAAVVWYADSIRAELPSPVEVLPMEMLPEVWKWADYLAIECNFSELAEVIEELVIHDRRSLSCDSQILVHTPLVCGGVGECGVCAVKTRKGWQLACKDGPVFDLAQVGLA